MTKPDLPRVLMVDSERSWRGGQEQVRLLMRGLVETGARVVLASPPDSALGERAASEGVERMGWGLPVLRRAMASGSYDIVHSHASRAHGAVAAARLFLATRPVHVVTRRVAFAAARGPISRWKYRCGAEAYIAISNGVRDTLVAAGVGTARVAVVADGIDLDKWVGARERTTVRREFGLDETTPVVGSIAALTVEKAPADLLRAAARVLAVWGEVCFLVVGEGKLRPQMEKLAAELGIAGRVVFTGFRRDAADLLGMFDVFVMSSHSEGLGTSILEAQAAGVPVVATRTGGIPEIVADGVNGLLVPPRSPELLADAIIRMLSDDGLRRSCARAGRESVRGYDYRSMVYKTLEVYRRLCDENYLPPKKDAIR
jgi:glycosyltransferase involved in cell wall biosynthesis